MYENLIILNILILIVNNDKKSNDNVTNNIYLLYNYIINSNCVLVVIQTVTKYRQS